MGKAGDRVRLRRPSIAKPERHGTVHFVQVNQVLQTCSPLLRLLCEDS